jgi:flagellar biogenesis protein FliO
MMGVGYTGQDLRGNPWVVLGVKSILLIALIVILIVIAKKIAQNLRKDKKKKRTITVVKQMPKSRPRAVKVKNKKV